MDMNTVNIIGRLTRDPEIKTSQSGNAICNLSIAVNGYKKEDVSFFDVVIFGKAAENVGKYLKKGSQAGITGHLSQSRFQRKDGSKGSAVNIIASSVQFIGGKSGGDQYERKEPVGASEEEVFSQMGDDFESGAFDNEVPF